MGSANREQIALEKADVQENGILSLGLRSRMSLASKSSIIPEHEEVETQKTVRILITVAHMDYSFKNIIKDGLGLWIFYLFQEFVKEHGMYEFEEECLDKERFLEKINTSENGISSIKGNKNTVVEFYMKSIY